MAMLSLALTLNCSSCSSSTIYSAATITTLAHRSRYSTCSFAKKSLKKSKREGPEAFVDLSDDKFVQNDKLLDTSLNPPDQNSNPIPSRSAVLQACIITSGLIAAFGTAIRQVSHVASIEGLPILDCSTEVSFGFEMWHLELIIGLVVLISSSRYLLLKIWPEFAESSEAANRQVLSSLQPLDYIVVAFLPGISEELLFRGAILPLLGMDWKSIGVAAFIFGVLHLGNGRKYSFVIWATFVGLAYGYATVLSSSIAVPMASRGDRIRTNPKVKPQTEPIQTENRKNRIWFGCIWMTFLLSREPQNREPQKPQTPRLTAKTALSFYYIPIPLKPH